MLELDLESAKLRKKMQRFLEKRVNWYFIKTNMYVPKENTFELTNTSTSREVNETISFDSGFNYTWKSNAYKIYYLVNKFANLMRRTKDKIDAKKIYSRLY